MLCISPDAANRASEEDRMPMPVRLVFVFGGTAAYLGLAILGWGG